MGALNALEAPFNEVLTEDIHKARLVINAQRMRGTISQKEWETLQDACDTIGTVFGMDPAQLKGRQD